MRVELDANATLPLAPELKALLEEVYAVWGNPSSLHRAGQIARTALEEARERLAALCGWNVEGVIWTSGATEAINLFLQGMARATLRKENRRIRLVATRVEHPAVLRTLEALERRDEAEVYGVRVDPQGRVDLEHLEEALQRGADWLVLQAANSEVGTLQPLASAADLAHRYGVRVFSDAAQWLLKRDPLEVSPHVDAWVVSAHKAGGPRGVGALLIRPDLSLDPLMFGGTQEEGLRPGTAYLEGILLTGEMALRLPGWMHAAQDRWASLRTRLERQIRERLEEVQILAAEAERLPNTTALLVPRIQGVRLAMALDVEGVAVSAGTACSSAYAAPSETLLAMGYSREDARSMIRLSMRPDITTQEVDFALDILERVIRRLRHSRP
jgi:cysteine desulfurase